MWNLYGQIREVQAGKPEYQVFKHPSAKIIARITHLEDE